MLCSRCRAQLSQHAFELPNWLMSVPLDSTCSSACAAPWDGVGVGGQMNSKSESWGVHETPFTAIISLHLLKVACVPKTQTPPLSYVKEWVKVPRIFSSSSFSKIADMKFVVKSNMREKTKRQGRSCKTVRNKKGVNQTDASLSSLHVQLQNISTHAPLCTRSGLLWSRRSLSHDVTDLMMGSGAWKEFLMRRSRYWAGCGPCELLGVLLSGALQAGATLAPKKMTYFREEEE